MIQQIHISNDDLSHIIDRLRNGSPDAQDNQLIRNLQSQLDDRDNQPNA